MMSKRILKGEDLLEIASFLVEKGFDQGISVEIAVDDESTLKKINDDFFYRYSANEEKDIKNDDSNIDDIIINVSGIKFRYFVK